MLNKFSIPLPSVLNNPSGMRQRNHLIEKLLLLIQLFQETIIFAIAQTITDTDINVKSKKLLH